MDLDRLIARTRALRVLREAPHLPRRLRELSGISQSDIGAACGVTGAAIAQWEAGHRTPSGDLAAKYIEVLAQAAEAAGAQRVAADLALHFPPGGYTVTLERRREGER